MQHKVLILAWLPEGMAPRLVVEFPQVEFVDAREPAVLEQHLASATACYGFPPIAPLDEAARLAWIQLTSAGVPQELCPVAARRNIQVTNLAGLYGPSIAEHALALMVMLARNMHLAVRNQAQKRWDRDIARTMSDLHGRSV